MFFYGFFFCVYGYIVCESVILTLARKENIIASSSLLLGKKRLLLVLCLDSDSSKNVIIFFCRGRGFMKKCEENFILQIAKKKKKFHLNENIRICWI